MPKQQLALEAGGPKRLVIAWKGLWKDMTLSLDGQVIGGFPNKAALQAGQEFPLPDGSRLHVQLVKKFAQAELRVLRNGQPLPGSAADPRSKLKVAYGVIFFVAALNILLGVITEVLDSAVLRNVGLGVASVVFGVIFLVLGVLVVRRSLVALIIAIVLFAADAVLGLVLVVSEGGQPAIGGIVMRVFFLFFMAQGIGAIRALKTADMTPPPVSYPQPPQMGPGGGYGAGPGGAGPGGYGAGPGSPPSDRSNPYRR